MVKCVRVRTKQQTTTHMGLHTVQNKVCWGFLVTQINTYVPDHVIRNLTKKGQWTAKRGQEVFFAILPRLSMN